MPYMFELVSTGKIDPGDVVSHVLPLSEAKHGYDIFDTKMDDCIKVVLNLKKTEVTGMEYALHEVLEVQEMTAFKTLCLTKSKTMKALVSDPKLKAIMQRRR